MWNSHTKNLHLLAVVVAAVAIVAATVAVVVTVKSRRCGGRGFEVYYRELKLDLTKQHE